VDGGVLAENWRSRYVRAGDQSSRRPTSQRSTRQATSSQTRATFALRTTFPRTDGDNGRYGPRLRRHTMEYLSFLVADPSSCGGSSDVAGVERYCAPADLLDLLVAASDDEYGVPGCSVRYRVCDRRLPVRFDDDARPWYRNCVEGELVDHPVRVLAPGAVGGEHYVVGGGGDLADLWAFESVPASACADDDVDAPGTTIQQRPGRVDQRCECVGCVGVVHNDEERLSGLDEFKPTAWRQVSRNGRFRAVNRNADGAGREIRGGDIGGIDYAHELAVKLDAIVETRKFNDHPVKTAWVRTHTDVCVELGPERGDRDRRLRSKSFAPIRRSCRRSLDRIGQARTVGLSTPSTARQCRGNPDVRA